MSEPRLRSAAAGAALVVLLALVAVAASGTGPGWHPGGSRGVSGGALDVVLTVALLGMLATVGAMVWAMRLRRDDDESFDLRAMLVAVVAILAFFALVAGGAYLLSKRDPSGAQQRIGQGGRAPALTTPSRGTARPGSQRDAHVSWPVVAGAAGVLVLLVGATSGRLWWSRRGRYRRHREAVEAMREVLEEALADLDGADPRAAVIAAYARMERALAVHGLPRRPAEAPLEYVRRALAELDADAAAVRELTDLFERAKFSEHAIGEDDRRAAVHALERVRDDLGAAA